MKEPEGRFRASIRKKESGTRFREGRTFQAKKKTAFEKKASLQQHLLGEESVCKHDERRALPMQRLLERGGKASGGKGSHEETQEGEY